MEVISEDAGARFQFLSDVVTREIDQGVLLVNLETGKTWRLNGVGAVVCQGIERGQDLIRIVNEVAGRFSAEAATVRRDIDALIAELRREGLIEPRGGG